MSEKAGDNFEKGIFWELYKDLERQFQDFLEYVPYLPGNERVYSFKLLNLILSIGGHVDSAFKEMVRYPKFSGDEHCKEILMKVKKKKTVPITLPLKAFETIYKLSEKTIVFKSSPESEKVTPFKPRSARAQSPKWWKTYNQLKHDVGVNIKEANLQTVRDALAGAFLLNAIHRPGTLRLLKLGLLDLGEIADWQTEEWIRKGMSFYGSISTPVFFYDYQKQ